MKLYQPKLSRYNLTPSRPKAAEVADRESNQLLVIRQGRHNPVRKTSSEEAAYLSISVMYQKKTVICT